MTEVAVYTKPVCVQCRAVKQKLDKQGVTYTEVNLLDAPEKLAEFQDLGLASAPVTVIGNEKPIAGFNPDALDAALAALEPDAAA